MLQKILVTTHLPLYLTHEQVLIFFILLVGEQLRRREFPVQPAHNTYGGGLVLVPVFHDLQNAVVKDHDLRAGFSEVVQCIFFSVDQSPDRFRNNHIDTSLNKIWEHL